MQNRTLASQMETHSEGLKMFDLNLSAILEILEAVRHETKAIADRALRHDIDATEWLALHLWLKDCHGPASPGALLAHYTGELAHLGIRPLPDQLSRAQTLYSDAVCAGFDPDNFTARWL